MTRNERYGLSAVEVDAEVDEPSRVRDVEADGDSDEDDVVGLVDDESGAVRDDEPGCKCELGVPPPWAESGWMSMGAVGVVGVATPLMLISAGWRCGGAVCAPSCGACPFTAWWPSCECCCPCACCCCCCW